MYTPDEYDDADVLERWALDNADAIIDSLPYAEQFSELLVALAYVKAARKAARQFAPDGLPFHEFLRMNVESTLKSYAGRDEYETAAERALALLEGEAAR